MSLSRVKLHGIGQTAGNTGSAGNPPSAVLVCADCGTADPPWAVLNRGVLLCNDCCSVHRSLGRHISQIRSLKNGSWHQNEMALVHTLYCNGANNVWEHALLDPSSAMAKSVRKPVPRDPVYPTKSDFIHAKYEQLQFALRPNETDAQQRPQWHDINRQMWACVRTAHVETTLRLLAIGADPNYMNAGCAPLHVAAKENQRLQVELLCIYGADAALPDDDGLTPVDVALKHGHNELAARLIQLIYECTDRLSMYLCGARRPQHDKGEHFIIPEMAAVSDSDMPWVTLAKRRLLTLSHVAFERLVQDVYDEVDRRENDAAWLAAMAPYDAIAVNERYIVPFLPLNPNFSATRNQSRQKLAKFNAREFAGLIIDVLLDAKRRENIDKTPAPNDAAAADLLSSSYHNGLSASGDVLTTGRLNGTLDSARSASDKTKSNDTSESFDRTANRGESGERAPKTNSAESEGLGEEQRLVQLDDYMELREQLDKTQTKLESIERTNREVLKQLHSLGSAVQRLHDENVQLRMAAQENAKRRSGSNETTGGQVNGHLTTPTRFVINGRLTPIATSTTPTTSSRLQRPNSLTGRGAASPEYARISGDLSNTSAIAAMSPSIATRPVAGENECDPPPYPDNVILQTEQLTQLIHRLLSDAQRNNTEHFAQYAESMSSLVDGMVSMVPSSVRQIEGSNMEGCLSAMVDACVTLTVHCNQAVAAAQGTSEQQGAVCHAVQSAYAVAKHAKQVLAIIQSLSPEHE